MKQNKFLRSVLFNWPIKILSVVFAVSLYLVVNYAVSSQREVVLPLQVITPRGFVAASSFPQTAAVTISGDDRIIQRIEPAFLIVSVDFSFVKEEGVASAPVIISFNESPLVAEAVYAVEPEVLRVFFVKTSVEEPSTDIAEEVGPIVL
jgi:YbbR domain-containing protein